MHLRQPIQIGYFNQSVFTARLHAFTLNNSNFKRNTPFIPGGIDNLLRDCRSVSHMKGILHIKFDLFKVKKHGFLGCMPMIIQYVMANLNLKESTFLYTLHV